MKDTPNARRTRMNKMLQDDRERRQGLRDRGILGTAAIEAGKALATEYINNKIGLTEAQKAEQAKLKREQEERERNERNAQVARANDEICLDPAMLQTKINQDAVTTGFFGGIVSGVIVAALWEYAAHAWYNVRPFLVYTSR